MWNVGWYCQVGSWHVRVVVVSFFLFSFFAASAQAEIGNPRWLRENMSQVMALAGKDFNKQDSLLTTAWREAQGARDGLSMLKVSHLHAFFTMHHREYKRASELILRGIAAARQQGLTDVVQLRDAYSYIALIYAHRNMPDSSMYWINIARPLAVKYKDDFNRSLLLTLQAVSLRDVLNFDQLNATYDSAIHFASATESHHDDVLAMYNKSFFIRMEGQKDWPRSLEVLLTLTPILNDPDMDIYSFSPWQRLPFRFKDARINVYRQISQMYLSLFNFDDAAHYQRLIVEEFKKMDFPDYALGSLAALGVLETLRGDHEKVHVYYDSCREYAGRVQSSTIVNDISFLYLRGWLAEQNQQLGEALKSYRLASATNEDENFFENLAMFRVYGKMGRFKSGDSVLLILRKQLGSSFSFNNPLFLIKERADYEMHRRHVAEAKDLSLHFYKQKDSLLEATHYLAIMERENEFNIKEKDRIIALQLKEQELQQVNLRQSRFQNFALASGIAALFLVMALLYRSYKQKKIQAGALAQKNQQIETLLRELHHRVKNNLQVVSGLLSLQGNRLDDDKARRAMEESRSRIDAMALIHQRLLVEPDRRSIDMQDYLENLAASLANSYGYLKEMVNVSVNLPSVNFDVDKAVHLGLIVNELVTNAFKHAFDGVSTPRIDVVLTMKQENLELTVRDNGKGMSSQTGKAASFGMHLVNLLAEQLKADMKVINDQGTHYIFTFADSSFAKK